MIDTSQSKGATCWRCNEDEKSKVIKNQWNRSWWAIYMTSKHRTSVKSDQCMILFVNNIGRYSRRGSGSLWRWTALFFIDILIWSVERVTSYIVQWEDQRDVKCSHIHVRKILKIIWKQKALFISSKEKPRKPYSQYFFTAMVKRSDDPTNRVYQYNTMMKNEETSMR